jgi:Ser/Thr protein kinase RdoA (MazF antagonist)
VSDGEARVSPREALEVARRWDAGATEIVPLRTGENCTWSVTLGGRPRVLRLTGVGHRSRRQLEAELAFIDHLSAGGMQVARAVPTPAGIRVLDTSGMVSTHERTHALVFEKLPGRHYAYHSPDIDRPLFHLWGETMARLHQLSGTFEAPPDARRPDWPDDPVAGCRVDGVSLDAETGALRDELVGWMRRIPPDPAHYGMVHGDFERTNFLLDDGSIRLFDFDDCCRHWFFWDIASALWVFRNAAADERARILGWFLEGYASIREPDARRMEAFSEGIRLRTVALLLYRLRRQADSASTADRDWIAHTRAWLHSPWSW